MVLCTQGEFSFVTQSLALQSLRLQRLLTEKGENGDKELYAFLIGALLGDGSINRNTPRYEEGASDVHKEYLQWKRYFLNRYIPCGELYAVNTRLKETGKTYQCWRFTSSTSPELKTLRRLWYPGDKKVVPFEFIFEHFTGLSFAVWYGDDGHRQSPKSGSKGSYLSTCAFSVPEIEFLIRVIAEKTDIHGSVARNSDGHPVISFLTKEWSKIESILGHFSLPGMDYKIAPR